MKFATPLTTILVALFCVMAPPVEFTVRVVPRTQPIRVLLLLTMLIFVPVAARLPVEKKSFVALSRVIFPLLPVPVETKFAVPAITRLPTDCVIVLPETSVRFVPSVAFDRSIGAVMVNEPLPELPIISVPAVMLFSSA